MLPDSTAFYENSVAAANRTFNEIVVVAAPGTGKTTTLVQLAEAMLSLGEVVAVSSRRVPKGLPLSQFRAIL